MKDQIFLRGNKSLQRSRLRSGAGPSILGTGLILLLSACGTYLPPGEETGRHLGEGSAPADNSSDIPQVVTPLPLVEPPRPEAELELYTASVLDVPVRELLFTLARDASINVDVHPDVTGNISLNAVDQTLPQILERISRQIDMRWSFDEFGNIVVEADTPFWRNYTVDYVNVARTAETAAEVNTSIAGGAGSTSTLTQSGGNNFWVTLPANLAALLDSTDAGSESEAIDRVISNAEAGVVSVYGTARQQEAVASFLESVQTRALYQVLIEATVVEVNLSDAYRGGVDWTMLDRNSGEIDFTQNVVPADNTNPALSPTNILTINRFDSPDAIGATISLLSQFGELRVLSSPKLMALNNQPAMLRVVNNDVYFTIEVEPQILTDVGLSTAVYTSTATTIPVGFFMSVTPQIGADDQVTLNVRPTISRVLRRVVDPNPALQEADITNEIPVIQLSEMESVLKVYSGQVAILGGLMQDAVVNNQDGVPVLSRLPGIRNLFSYRDEEATKTELIVFIRPVVVRQPSLSGDLEDYRSYLPANGLQPVGPTLPEGMPSLPGGE